MRCDEAASPEAASAHRALALLHLAEVARLRAWGAPRGDWCGADGYDVEIVPQI